MKRLIKVRVRAGNRKAGEDQMIYPDIWNPEEIDMHGGCTMLNPSEIDVCMTGDIGRGGSEQWLIIALPEALALVYAEDPDIAIVDSIEADTVMEGARIGNNVPLERIKDPARIQAIATKLEMNKSLADADKLPITGEDKDSMNPEHLTRGINKTRRPAKEVMPDIDDDLAGMPANKTAIQRV